MFESAKVGNLVRFVKSYFATLERVDAVSEDALMVKGQWFRKTDGNPIDNSFLKGYIMPIPHPHKELK